MAVQPHGLVDSSALHCHPERPYHCPGASQIGVDVVVWAIVSECSVDGEKLFFEGVRFFVCNFISEEDFIEKFGFIFAYGVVVDARYSPLYSCLSLKMCQTFNNRIFSSLNRALFMVNQNSSSVWIDA